MCYVAALTLRAGSFEQCARHAGISVADPATAATCLAASDTFAACRATVANWAGVVALGGTAAVLVTAFALYWWLPAWRQRRGRLVSVERLAVATSPHGATRLSAHLRELAERAGVLQMPTFLVNPRALTAGAVAFGRSGRYTVCLDAGLLPRRATDPETFDAVVLHELAHVRRGDVDMAYLAVALWRVMAIGVLIPFVALQGWGVVVDAIGEGQRLDWVQATPSVGKLAFAGFLVMQVYLARNEILRDRELCADLDAVAAGAEPAVWADPRLVAAHPPDQRSLSKVVSPILHLLRPHPTWAHRRAVLAGAVGIQTGASGLQGLLAISAMLGLFGAVDGWPGWLFASVAYLMAPLVVVAVAASVPPKRADYLRVKRPAGARVAREYRGQGVRAWWPLGAMAVIVSVLLVLDPIGTLWDGASGWSAPTAPHSYQAEVWVPPLGCATEDGARWSP